MVMRISGLASGMDTESIVNQLMSVARLPLDRLKQQKQTLEWQRDDYRSMNTLLLDFRSQLTNMKVSSTYRARQVSSSDDSRVSVTASSGAAQASYSISSVKQLAAAETRIGNAVNMNDFNNKESAVWKTGAVLTESITTTGDSKHITAGSLAGYVPGEDKPLSIKVNGEGFKVVTTTGDLKANEVRIDSATGQLEFGKMISKGSAVSINYIADSRTDSLAIAYNSKSVQLTQGAINSISSIELKTGDTTETLSINGTSISKDGVEVAKIDLATGKITFNENMPLPDKDSKEAMSLEVTYDHKYTTFSMDTSTSKGARHETFFITGTESLNSVVNRVNASNIGVSMMYDDHTGKMVMTRKETGTFSSDGNEIKVDGDFISNVLGFAGATKTDAQNAVFVVNGLETQRSSNSFTMNGVSFTLKQTFNVDGGSSEPAVTVGVTNDSKKVLENIKTFVEKYNELISAIQKKTNEEVYRDYKPLTETEKEQLSDKQQEQWEEKARSGLLRRDSTLTSALSTMRMNFSGPVSNSTVSGAFNHLSKIGITTTSNYMDGGKLQIDETKLLAAIEADPESVEKLFMAEGTADSSKGIANRLYDTVNNTMDQLRQKAGNSYSTNQTFTIGREIIDINTRIDRFEDRLAQLESRYYAQYAAMEKAMQKANEQSASILQQFSSM